MKSDSYFPFSYSYCCGQPLFRTSVFKLPQFCHSFLELFLVALAYIFNKSCGVPFVLWCPLTAPADELPLVFAEQVELLSVFLT